MALVSQGVKTTNHDAETLNEAMGMSKEDYEAFVKKVQMVTTSTHSLSESIEQISKVFKTPEEIALAGFIWGNVKSMADLIMSGTVSPERMFGGTEKVPGYQ